MLEGVGPRASGCPAVPRAKRFSISPMCFGAQIGVLRDADI